MLVIGHRGAAGLAPENTLEAFRAGLTHGADMLEFDVQLTIDGVPLVIHDSTLLRTHKKALIVRWSKHESIRAAAAKGHKIATLEEVLDEFFGVILLNLEVKSRKAGRVVAELLKSRYITQPSDWQNILISSFKARELLVVRRIAPQAELGMLHDRNPFIFMAYQRRLNLTAIGFHRLHLNPLALEVAKRLEMFTYAYTVNRPEAAKLLAEKGLDAIVTDNPRLIRKSVDAIL